MKQLLQKLSLALMLVAISAITLRAQTNQYLDFDGVDDYVEIPGASATIAGSSAMTITGWFYNFGLSYGKGMMGFRSTGGGFYLIELNNGVIECRFQNSANTLYQYVTPNFTIVPQTWQHYAWVYNGSNITLYRDGNVVGSAAASGTITNANIPFAIGKSILSGFNFVYKGGIDEVTVWNKALSQTEIQNMMTTEPVGTEPNLQMYYKFNQGVPAGNNTSITNLTATINSPAYDGSLALFALNGSTSNFLGTLNNSFQAISFPQITTKLTTDPPFTLNAMASSGLPVTYTVLSGPATVSGNTVTLNGTPGMVTIEATQPGNAQYNAATPVVNTFAVVDPAANLPIIEARNPVDATDIYMPTLGEMQLAAKTSIDYPGLFSVSNVQFVINGTTYPAIDHGNGHYTAWWTPSAYGAQTITINSTSNFGATATTTLNVNVTATSSSINNLSAFSNVWLYTDTASAVRDGYLPSFVGAFNNITATLVVTCPSGGCGPWDRVASIDAQGHDGQWFEIIRYITPYGVACNHSIDLTDYMSLLQGKVRFRANCTTLDNGFLYQLKFDYAAGAPPHKYSSVKQVWKQIYPFGDYTNLQPVQTINHGYSSLAVESKLKLVSTGHGWGTNNTGNAAEFYNATHNIWVNGANTFSQVNWKTCNPNPDGCQPQNGTWTYNRAGWCPGSIAPYFDYDLTPFIATGNIDLDYKFYSSYIDQCHPNNPNCVTGVTCADCNDGFNPVLDVNCNLVTWYDVPTSISKADENRPEFSIHPNPSKGVFYIRAISSNNKNYTVEVLDIVGKVVKEFNWNGLSKTVDLSAYSKGVYAIKVTSDKKSEFKKLVIQ